MDHRCDVQVRQDTSGLSQCHQGPAIHSLPGKRAPWPVTPVSPGTPPHLGHQLSLAAHPCHLIAKYRSPSHLARPAQTPDPHVYTSRPPYQCPQDMCTLVSPVQLAQNKLIRLCDASFLSQSYQHSSWCRGRTRVPTLTPQLSHWLHDKSHQLHWPNAFHWPTSRSTATTLLALNHLRAFWFFLSVHSCTSSASPPLMASA